MSKILKLLKSLIDLLISYFNYKNTELLNIKLLDKDKLSLKELENKVDDAVYNKDDDFINNIINKSIVILFCLFTAGCITKTIYVPSDQLIKSIVYEGVQGKFVPDVVFSELLKSHIRCKYYEKKYGNIDE